jgi:hypothetical protein
MEVVNPLSRMANAAFRFFRRYAKTDKRKIYRRSVRHFSTSKIPSSALQPPVISVRKGEPG